MEMGFGENNLGMSSSSMMMMMPLQPFLTNPNSNPNPNPNPSSSDTCYLPFPPPLSMNNNLHHQQPSISVAAASSLILMSNHNSNIAGGYYNTTENDSNSSSIRAKIMAHPHYPRLLSAYLNCQKIGAPDEVVVRLEQVRENMIIHHTNNSSGCSSIGDDPALDQFMEAFFEMLIKYEEELSKPFEEVMMFYSKIESQLKALSVGTTSDSAVFNGGDAVDPNVSSDEDADLNDNYVDPLADDRELKCQLLRKYGGSFSRLKQEFNKKTKKGKLPKESRAKLLDWWNGHQKWPYPAEHDKIMLAETTGLDPKQINNWFINQRKRHWKPSDEVHYMQEAASNHFFMDNMVNNNINQFTMDCRPSML